MSVTNARAALNQSFGSRQLQVLFDRGISNRHVNQSAILKPRDELVVFDRIEGDATGAPPEHAVIFGAKSSGGVPVKSEAAGITAAASKHMRQATAQVFRRV